jgi:uncharacterized protein DUF2795
VVVNAREAAEIQVVLEGVPLPAGKQELLAYARTQDRAAAERLATIPDREYSSIDEVGEALAPVQPAWPRPGPSRPRDESGQPPGGDAYVDPNAEPGAVRRPSGPASNPPQKTLEQQSKTQKEQAERQKQLG